MVQDRLQAVMRQPGRLGLLARPIAALPDALLAAPGRQGGESYREQQHLAAPTLPLPAEPLFCRDRPLLPRWGQTASEQPRLDQRRKC
eukprot:scaffold8182_cov120-Isochrysis_galbana.AAC.1